MQTGRFDLQLPPDREDALGELGRELDLLAGSLEQRFREMARLQELSEKVGAGFFLPEILDAVYEGFRGLIPYDRIGCALVDRDGSPDEWTVTAKWARAEYEAVEIDRGYSQPLTGSNLAKILETGLPRIINDLEAYLAQKPDSDATRRILDEGIRSSLTCPLLAHGLPVGFLFFSSREKDTYRDIHPDTFLRIAHELSLVVEKSLIMEDLFTLTRQLRKAQKRLEHQVTHDPLTGIMNRGGIQSRLDQEVARARRNGTRVGVILLDIDHFKQVNDRYGHPAGDRVLTEVAQALESSMRTFEAVGRWGGEEFLMIPTGVDQKGMCAAANRLRLEVEELAVHHEGVELRVTISAGGSSMAPSGNDTANALALVRAADEALYRAKEAGRNQVAYSPPELRGAGQEPSPSGTSVNPVVPTV